MIITAFAVVLVKREKLFLHAIFAVLLLLLDFSIKLYVIVQHFGFHFLLMIFLVMINLSIQIHLFCEGIHPHIVHHHRLGLPMHVGLSNIVLVLMMISFIVSILHPVANMIQFESIFKVGFPIMN